ncbi:hypothetical protein [Heyndrickxia sporothermodurans]|uniref:hypothetical protein n=3 Tax=Bacillati TaxID=1783272 RepID=UPI0035E31AB8
MKEILISSKNKYEELDNFTFEVKIQFNEEFTKELVEHFYLNHMNIESLKGNECLQYFHDRLKNKLNDLPLYFQIWLQDNLKNSKHGDLKIYFGE